MIDYNQPTGNHYLLNTHFHDGNLDKKSLLWPKLDNVKQIAFNEKTNAIKVFSEDIKKINVAENNSTARSYFDTVLNDQTIFDSSNNIQIIDLLYILAMEWTTLCIKNNHITKDFASEFFLQCMDMQTGLCVQGRTNRLWQIALSYEHMFEYSNVELL